MKFEKDEKLWFVPIRYWEDGENPVECTVLEPFWYEGSPLHSTCHDLYVFNPEYGHAVYMDPGRAYFTKENAVKAAKVMTELKELQFTDHCHHISGAIFRKAIERRNERKQ